MPSNPGNKALDWYKYVVNNVIDDDGVRQRVDLSELIKSVESDPESAQIVVQLLEKDLEQKGAEDGATLRGIWIAACLMLSDKVSDPTIRTLSAMAPSICAKAINFIKENNLM